MGVLAGTDRTFDWPPVTHHANGEEMMGMAAKRGEAASARMRFPARRFPNLGRSFNGAIPTISC